MLISSFSTTEPVGAIVDSFDLRINYLWLNNTKYIFVLMQSKNNQLW